MVNRNTAETEASLDALIEEITRASVGRGPLYPAGREVDRAEAAATE